MAIHQLTAVQACESLRQGTTSPQQIKQHLLSRGNSTGSKARCFSLSRPHSNHGHVFSFGGLTYQL